MDGVMKNIGLVLALLILGNYSNAQFGLSGGVSMLKGFGIPQPFVGFHIGGELPRDDQNSIYGRISFYAKQTETISSTTMLTANDLLTIPYNINVAYKSSMNYTVLEGGNRYYIGDGYDSGFGAYGGGNFMIMFNSVKRNYDDYDETKYSLPVTETPRGSIFSVAFGLNGGVKHTFAGVGTLYGDAGFGYVLIGKPSNGTAQTTNLYSNLLFTFSIGFRKEFY